MGGPSSIIPSSRKIVPSKEESDENNTDEEFTDDKRTLEINLNINLDGMQENEISPGIFIQFWVYANLVITIN